MQKKQRNTWQPQNGTAQPALEGQEWIKFLAKNREQETEKKYASDEDIVKTEKILLGDEAIENWREDIKNQLGTLDALAESKIDINIILEETKASHVVKVYHEMYDPASEKEIQKNYKTVIISSFATVADLLVAALKKYKFLDPKFLFTGTATTDIRTSVQNEGWIIFTSDNGHPLSLHEKVSNVVKKSTLAIDEKAIFIFKQIESDAPFSFIQNYKTSGVFDAINLFKLKSSFTQTDYQKGPIKGENWDKRFVVLVKNRFLLFFESKTHSRWKENVLNQVDMKNVRIIDTHENRVDIEGEKGIVLYTRKSAIYLSLKEEVCERFIRQLKYVQDQIIQKVLEDTQKKVNQQSRSDNVELSILFQKLATRRFINDIDRPPYIPTTKEFRDWSMNKNLALHMMIKELAALKLSEIFRNSLKLESEEIRQALMLIVVQKREFPAEETNAFSKMKNFLRIPFGDKQESEKKESPKKGLFGVSIEDLSNRYDSTGKNIPVIPPFLEQCINYIKENGLETCGIFRVAGSLKRIENLKKLFEKNEEENNFGPVDFTGYNVHDVASVLKSFFRELPEPLLPFRLYRLLLKARELKSTPELMFSIFRMLVITISPAKRAVLFKLLEFLNLVAKHAEDKGDITGNLMNESNLAVVFGPNLLREDSNSSSLKSVPSSKFLTDGIVPKDLSGSIDFDDKQNRRVSESMSEVNQSSELVEIVKIMIVRYVDLFTIPEEIWQDLKISPLLNTIGVITDRQDSLNIT